MKFIPLAAILAIPLAACTSSDYYDDDLDMVIGESQLRGSAYRDAVYEASEYPLGSIRNPVRVSSATEQRAYLKRLRCSNGETPLSSRRGSGGRSPYGNPVDIYTVQCIGSHPEKTDVYIDMYHRGHVENQPVAGFRMDRRY